VVRIQGKMYVAYAGVSIVNAIPCGRGAVIPINLKAYAREGGKNRDSPLINAIEDYLFKKFNLKSSFEVFSEIPEGVGLKSSSAVSVAILSSIKERTRLYPPLLSAIITKEYGLSITGAFDDAVSSYEGKISFTDNLNLKILKLIENPYDLNVIIFINGKRNELNINLMKENCKFFNEAFMKGINGNIFEAIKINGYLMAKINNYDMQILDYMIKKGAITSGISGNGPAYFALVKKGEEGPLLDYLGDKAIVTQVVK